MAQKADWRNYCDGDDLPNIVIPPVDPNEPHVPIHVAGWAGPPEYLDVSGGVPDTYAGSAGLLSESPAGGIQTTEDYSDFSGARSAAARAAIHYVSFLPDRGRKSQFTYTFATPQPGTWSSSQDFDLPLCAL